MGDDASKYTVECKGIVAYAEEEWRLEDLLTREPAEDEFLVEMIATGVCHTDIAGYGGIYPRVLGHEGAGRILRLGSDKLASEFNVGDLVILSAAACEKCRYCTSGHPAYCVEHANLTLHANEPNFVLKSDPNKKIGGGYFGQSSFASPVPVKASSASKVTKLVSDTEELKLYAPLGCGIMTGAGAITHVGKCQPDDVLAVIGLGGVGLAGICAAKKLGVKTIIAVDLLQSRMDLAKSLGATASLLSSEENLQSQGHDSLDSALRELTPDKLGCTHILDTSPSVKVLASCLEALQNRGMLLQVGVKPTGATMDLDLLTHMVHGRQLVGVIEGDRDPKEAIPELLQWCKDGVLPVKKLFKNFEVNDFESARKGMEKGEVIKGVLVW